VTILLMWLANNIPNRVDLEWVKRGGGIVGNDHPPATSSTPVRRHLLDRRARRRRRRNVRLFPDVPVLRDQHRRDAVGADVHAAWQCCSSLHAGSHYIGTIGMEAPSRRWPKAGRRELGEKHHSLWLDEEKNKGPAGATPRATPAE